MDDTRAKQEQFPNPRDPANNNIDGLEGAPINSAPKSRSVRPMTG